MSNGLLKDAPAWPPEKDSLRFAIMDYLDEHDGECNADLSLGIAQLIKDSKPQLSCSIAVTKGEACPNHGFDCPIRKDRSDSETLV